jgi:type I restriction enzyme R subunit
MQAISPDYLGLIEQQFNDKDVDALIEHFRDPERRKKFFKEYKEIEMLYEIISPDAFLRPFIDDYTTLSAIYLVVRKAYSIGITADREFQRKTNALVQNRISTLGVERALNPITINGNTIELIKMRNKRKRTTVINLVKSIEKTAEENSEDPFLITMANRALIVQEKFEQRQTSTKKALDKLLAEVKKNEARKKEQAEKGFDSLTFFVYQILLDAKVGNPELISNNIKAAFVEFPNWRKSEGALRELRNRVTFAIFAECDELNQVTPLVDELFTLLEKVDRIK